VVAALCGSPKSHDQSDAHSLPLPWNPLPLSSFRQSIMLRPALVILLLAISLPAQSQQFKVYTRVTRPAVDSQESADTLSRSLTLFHAGLVFDWIPSMGEVTVVDPAHDRFIIFTGRRMIGTKVSFDEVSRILGTAREETSNWAARLMASKEPKSIQIATPIQFQLAPEFTEKFDGRTRMLTLSSPEFSYRVECRKADSPELLEAYLSYADRAAQLNYVLYPDTLFPAPRIALNASLRKFGQLPSRVQLNVQFDTPLVLAAEHQFGWKLESIDRQHLNQWKKLIESPDMQWVRFREYHRRVIIENNVQARR